MQIHKGREVARHEVDFIPLMLIRFAVHNILEETIRKFTKSFVFRDYQMNQLICIMNVMSEIDGIVPLKKSVLHIQLTYSLN